MLLPTLEVLDDQRFAGSKLERLAKKKLYDQMHKVSFNLINLSNHNNNTYLFHSRLIIFYLTPPP